MEPTTENPSSERFAGFDLVRCAGRGFAAGLVATTAMTATMFALQRLGLLGRMPPRLLTERTLARLGFRRKTSSTTRKVLTAINHYGFGGTMGALFEIGRGALAARRGRAGSRGALLGSGVAFGTLVWAASYAGWIPAMGLMPRPTKDRRFRPTSMVLAHWVYGGTLSAAIGTRLASPHLEVNP